MKTITPLLVALMLCVIGCQHDDAKHELPIEHQPMGEVEPSQRIEVLFRQADGQDSNRLLKREYVRKGIKKNAENAEGGIDFSMGDMRSSQKQGNRAPDIAGQVTSNGFIVIAGIIILGGIGALILKRYKTGAMLIGVGIGVGLMPVVFDQYGHWIVLGGLLITAGAVAYLVFNLKKQVNDAEYFNDATSDWNIGKLFTDGDPRAGGALAHLRMHKPSAKPDEVAKASKFKSDAKIAGKPDKA